MRLSRRGGHPNAEFVGISGSQSEIILRTTVSRKVTGTVQKQFPTSELVAESNCHLDPNLPFLSDFSFGCVPHLFYQRENA